MGHRVAFRKAIYTDINIMKRMFLSIQLFKVKFSQIIVIIKQLWQLLSNNIGSLSSEDSNFLGPIY